jgi:hypothetical protein
VKVCIDERHIRAAQRGQSRLTPLEIAVLDQTPYLPTGFVNGSITLMDEDGTEFQCPLSPEAQEFLSANCQARIVQPITVTLDCESE